MDGNLIREARKRQDMTQEDLARALGVKRALISKYENGIIEPSLSMLKKLANALKVTVGYLQGEEHITTQELLQALKNKDAEVLSALIGIPGSVIFLSDEDEAQLQEELNAKRKESEKNITHLKWIVRNEYSNAFSKDDLDIVKQVISGLSQLNIEGQKKVIERVEELTEIPKYKKE